MSAEAEFGEELRQARVRLRLSQANVATMMAEFGGIYVHPTAITRMERGTRHMRLDEATLLSYLLDVPLPRWQP